MAVASCFGLSVRCSLRRERMIVAIRFCLAWAMAAPNAPTSQTAKRDAVVRKSPWSVEYIKCLMAIETNQAITKDHRTQSSPIIDHARACCHFWNNALSTPGKSPSVSLESLPERLFWTAKLRRRTRKRMNHMLLLFAWTGPSGIERATLRVDTVDDSRQETEKCHKKANVRVTVPRLLSRIQARIGGESQNWREKSEKTPVSRRHLKSKTPRALTFAPRRAGASAELECPAEFQAGADVNVRYFALANASATDAAVRPGCFQFILPWPNAGPPSSGNATGRQTPG